MNASPEEPVDDGRMEPHLAFAELGRTLLAEQPLEAILQRVADLAKRTVTGADEVSVTLVEGDKAHTAAFTGEPALALDERQYEAGFGPCLDAAQAGDTFPIEDMSAADTMWPKFCEQALAKGIHSTLSIGLPVMNSTIGAINLYATRPRAFGEHDVQLAQTFGSYAAVALANASLYARTAALADELQQALHSRAVIDQAKGIIMAKQHCSADEAFAILSRASQSSNRKLRDIAQAMVDGLSGNGTNGNGA
ncbi:MAG: hypothetical protein QOJ90_58 [Actinomycetota bacterium]|jgi:GAF domain-containing protein|nr:hypothetical protein [Actinomycetota bacterium]